jgi:hypothetical protein
VSRHEQFAPSWSLTTSAQTLVLTQHLFQTVYIPEGDYNFVYLSKHVHRVMDFFSPYASLDFHWIVRMVMVALNDALSLDSIYFFF